MARPKSPEEFRRLIIALSSEIADAQVHWKLYCDLLAALQAQTAVGQQSNTFWYLTLNAHAESAVLHLCRVYDKDGKSLHLLGWLEAIKDNLQAFEKTAPKNRGPVNPFDDSPASTPGMPDATALDNDIRACELKDPLVRRLVQFRGGAAGHRSAKTALDVASGPAPFSESEMEALLERARNVFNRYCDLFGADAFSVNTVGRDDYQFIFKGVAEQVARSEKAVKEFMEKHK
ncbi:MAG TPA: hypothetical protein VH105_21415 [Burkholderiales bacterium]|jgi:hypothetical protein|nr:hypothetical protein [Burkholderiales bacterium]